MEKLVDQAWSGSNPWLKQSEGSLGWSVPDTMLLVIDNIDVIHRVCLLGKSSDERFAKL